MARDPDTDAFTAPGGLTGIDHGVPLTGDRPATINTIRADIAVFLYFVSTRHIESV